MPKTWKQIFSDKAIADNTEVVIGNEKVTIGELRAFDAEQSGKVSAELDRATRMQQALEKDQVAAASLLAELATANNNPPANPGVPSAAPSTPDYMSDPILRPLAEQVKAALDGINSLKQSLTTEITGLRTTVQTAASSYINDDWKRNFDGMPERSDPVVKDIVSKVSLRDALKYAGDHKIVDHRGVPDPVEATRRITEGDRLAAIRAHEREEGKREGIDLGRKQLAAEMPKPGVLGRRAVQPPSKNMDEAISKLAEDPEMQSQLAGLQRVQ